LIKEEKKSKREKCSNHNVGKKTPEKRRKRDAKRKTAVSKRDPVDLPVSRSLSEPP